MPVDQEARVRGGATVVTGAGAGATVTTGADVAGGEVTGVDGEAGADGGAACELEPDAAGATATPPAFDELDGDGGDPTGVLDALEDVVAGPAPAAGTAAGSVTVPTVDDPVTPEAPVTLSSIVAGFAAPLCWLLRASAATIAALAAKLRPAVSARDAGAVEPLRFARLVTRLGASAPSASASASVICPET
jgi:hypothetical protein